MEQITQLNYRTAGLQDKDQLKQLGIAAYGQYKEVLTEDNWEKLNGFLHDDEKLVELINRSKCFVCFDNSQMVGMAYFVPHGNAWDIFKNEWSYIRMVDVQPGYTSRGIAKALTLKCIDYAHETNEQCIALHTSEFMNAARHIYEGLGFKQVQEMDRRLGKRYWLYMLHLNA
jgi:ribosomal protein S18 acetylase RimI-like enzyme